MTSIARAAMIKKGLKEEIALIFSFKGAAALQGRAGESPGGPKSPPPFLPWESLQNSPDWEAEP